MNREIAEKTYDVLVAEAGAPESERDHFMAAWFSGRLEEYRFRGSLGFGGKYRGHSHMVDCYPEDLNDERREIIARTNAALAEAKA